MGKLFLTMDELQQFPTIANLTEQSYGKEPELWGLCQNDAGDISFREGNSDWLLQVPLSEIFENAHYDFGEKYNPNNIILFYGVDCSTSHDVYVDFIELSSYEEMIKGKPPFEWQLIQN